METEQLYETYQPLLFSLAYRILGSVMDAEDIVHDVFISLNNIEDVQSIENMKAYLCKMVTNRSIDKLRSAAHKRNVYVGMWLPEPFVEETDDPSESFVMKESISTAYLLLLQQLSEVERVVFILREVFGYDYEEIASIVDKSSVNCRKIFQRARKSILDKPKQSKLSTKKMAAYVEKFVSSLQCGDAQGMLEVLKTDAILKADGGGKVTTAVHPIYSANRIIRLFFGIGKKFPPVYNVEYKIVNGAPGVIVKVKNKVTYVLSFTFENEKIANIYMMVNPEKLIHLNE
ncbi:MULTISPECIES: sigma-70 family RNA polymerase sigma factor [Bacillus]|uniref:RNA polymerase sigma factor SigJ n=1 Tax=Bacillus thuringiensis serovar sooncheon TaxID=180891 RepID=A0A9Q5X4J1_BACTU|nr:MULTISPECIES: sigma-70 family RNA polymerase sigma factor [Bacillus]MDC7972934.1 sigma-70 family RNA polymerase sigma factor [Bacillus sp. BLCC-B18]OTW72489.1 RNA polymerase sigma factor SigJ [Bacillus thuringiensis serovar coreanensis]OTX49545.1 RNA polymerase sigma factor SigJ [Bacillus thuringiensis serovar sooncheon]OTX57276.1 RNA polymerase sigma factor SigJ [Bacillus thuringiensis serovar guiyangiensis]OTX71878.1 RNA polymerase sigma factor SigJ [Bacillus thuringiensis serovar roskild